MPAAVLAAFQDGENLLGGFGADDLAALEFLENRDHVARGGDAEAVLLVLRQLAGAPRPAAALSCVPSPRILRIERVVLMPILSR